MNLIETIIEYPFLQNAYLVGIILSFISPIFGAFIIAKRANLIPDTIGHVGFTASTFTSVLMSLGIVSTNFSPIGILIFFVVLAALFISYINEKYPNAKEIALAFVMTFSLGLAIIFYQISFVKTDLSAFLFGSIVGLQQVDVFLILIVSIIAIIIMSKIYQKLLLVSFDEVFAKIRGINQKKINAIYFILLALVIASSIKFVGVLLISALMNLPVMIVLPFTKSFKSTIIWAIIISECSMIVGLILSFYLNLPTSGIVAVLLGIIFLLALGIEKTHIFLVNNKK